MGSKNKGTRDVRYNLMPVANTAIPYVRKLREYMLRVLFSFDFTYMRRWAFQMALVVKNPPASADVRDGGSISGSGRSPGGGHSNPLQYS